MSDPWLNDHGDRRPVIIYTHDLPTMICRECGRQGCFTAEDTQEGTDLVCKCGHVVELAEGENYHE